MSSPSTAAFLAAERNRVEAGLREVVADVRGGDAVLTAVRHALDAGGKRLRPILCVAGYRAAGGSDDPGIYRLAASLELIHTYSLIHDDLPSMDDDAVRRGRPAAHVVHGIATATAAGAALIPLAAGNALRAAAELGLPPPGQAYIVRTLMRAAGGGGMVGGQLLDLEAEGRGVTREELERIHRMKTGALLAAAPRIGGIAGSAPGPVLDALHVYGEALGLAFQIADDILDVTGSTAVLGKTAGRDRALGKATYAGLAGVEAARERAEREVRLGLAALEAAAVRTPDLEALARYAVERDR